VVSYPKKITAYAFLLIISINAYGMSRALNTMKSHVARSPKTALALGATLGMTGLSQVYIPAATFGKTTSNNKVVTVASHGLGANKEQTFGYHTQSGNPNAFIEGRLETFDYDDVHNPNSSCLGQEADINKLHENTQKHKDCNLFGWSRGAVAIANYAGTRLPQNVGAMILESPFDDIKSVVQHKTGFASLASGIGLVATNHNPNGIQPIKVAHSVDLDQPMLIYCSKEDSLIPAKSSIEYYNALRRTGHHKVHLLVVDRGAHANIINGPDGQIVRNVIHAFLKDHNRPYNAEWAKAGQERYKQCQPSCVPDSKPKKSSWFSSLSS